MYIVFFHHIVIVFVRNYHNMVKKFYIPTYGYHILCYLGNCEALHEITDLVQDMVSVCAP